MAKVYGFDEYTAREVVRTVRNLKTKVDRLDSKARVGRASSKPLLMYAKTTLEPGGTCEAYLAKRSGGENDTVVLEPDTTRGVYTIDDYLHSSFLLGIDDYDSSSNDYQEAMCLVFGDVRSRAYTPVSENNLILAATPDSTIATGATGTFSVYSDTTDTTYNITDVYVGWGDNGEGVTSSKESWIRYSRFARRWEWIGGDCE